MSKTYENVTSSGGPTGLGLSRGPESAPTANMTTANRATKAKANEAAFGGKSTSPDPCDCGCCDMTRSAI